MAVFQNCIASLFYQVLYMSIVATIIGMIILLLRRLFHKRLSPKCNYIIWIAFIIALIFPISIPSRLSIYNYVDISNVKLIENTYIHNNCNKIDDLKTQSISNMNNKLVSNNIGMLTTDVRVIIATIWLVISAVKLIKMLVSYKLLTYKIGKNEVKDERIIKILDECKRRLNIKRNIKIIRQKYIKSPSIFGIFNIRILLTDAMISEDDIAISDVMLHELSHYKRKDNILNFIMMVAKSIYWFNPAIDKLLKYVKKDVELATDEMAIKNMNVEETRIYCKVIIQVAGMCSTKLEPILGLASKTECLEDRIDWISLKEKFEKRSNLIFTLTAFIILMICLLFYPTSFGTTYAPELYLKTEDGKLTEIINTDNNENANPNVIKLNKGSRVQLVIKNGNPDEYIYYNKVKLNGDTKCEKVTNVLTNEMVCFDNGEYIYNFITQYGNKQNSNYIVKIIVE